MRNVFCLVSFCALNASAGTLPVDLGKADAFAVLAGSTITNTGPSLIHGDVGVSLGTAITGFSPGTISGGVVHANDSASFQAQADLTAAYNFAASEACATNLTGQDLGGLTLQSGVYCFSTSAQLSGILTLDAQNNTNAVFIFQIGSTLTSAVASSVIFANGGQGDSVFWQVGSAATLGANTTFEGNILAFSAITLNTGAQLGCGRALARNGAVTLDTTDISIDTPGCETTTALPAGSTPEPGTAWLLAGVLLLSPAMLRLRFFPALYHRNN